MKKGVITILNLSVLGSGSSGNAIYIESDRFKLLIDAGFSCKQISERLNKIGRDISDIDAVIVTHEHIDHCRGIKVMGKKVGVPIYMTEETYKSLPDTVSAVGNVRFFEAGASFALNDLICDTFSIPHDAVNPVGVSLRDGRFKVSIATDLGYVTHLVKERIKDSDLLVIESNHDPEMLLSGPYPWPLKQRVKGKSGHLSNEDCGKLLGDIAGNRLKNVILAHLSEKNNHPEIARITAQQVLEGTGVELTVACQHNPGKIIAHS